MERVDELFDVASPPDGLALPFEGVRQLALSHTIPYRVPMATQKLCNLFIAQEQWAELRAVGVHDRGPYMKASRAPRHDDVVMVERLGLPAGMAGSRTRDTNGRPALRHMLADTQVH